MTQLLTRSTERPDTTPPVNLTSPHRPGRGARATTWLSEHRTGSMYLLPLLVLTAAARILNMGGSPQRIDDEGTYTAQAWAVQTLGELGHYTYWYDHPPLGWIQIAGWTTLTGGFARYDVAVTAGREAMAVAAVASAALLWLLARRLGIGRPGAAVAVAVFALSPLAVQFTRTVYLDNVATPWMLAAFVLALGRRNQLTAFAGSAACFAVAVLSKETYLLLLPFLVWQLWRSSEPRTRRYTLSVAGALFALAGAVYVLFAAVKSEVVPGQDRVSLWEGITFQLLTRDDSGSVLDATSQAGRSVGVWLELDTVLAVVGTLCAVVGLAVRRVRPYAAAYLFLLLVMAKPGYLPVPYVVAMLPLAALLVGAVLDVGLRRGRALVALSAVAALGAGAVAAPLWAGQLRGLWSSDLDQPLRQAQDWAVDNVADGEQILVDDAAWLDLVRGGLSREDVVWYYKADTDPAVYEATPNGWADYEYVLVTEGMRRSDGGSGVLASALDSSVRVAGFGEGSERVEILRVLPDGTDAFYAAQFSDERAREAAGRALAVNPRIDLSREAAGALRSGRVDSRLVALLAFASGQHRLTVDAFPVVPGEGDSELARRSVTISQVDGKSADSGAGRELAELARQQPGAYTPAVAQRVGTPLSITFPVAEPEYLLPEPPPEG